MNKSVYIRESVIKSVYSSLGRFTQADTIIPTSQGIQGYDRYVAMENNPVRYADATGHMVSDGLVGEGGGCDRLCLDSLGSRDESDNKEDREDNAKPSLGDIHGGSKNPGLSSPASAKNCEGVSGFSYCKYLDDTYVILEWDGQHVQVNLAYLDLTNVEDLKIFLAVQAYTDAADSFEENRQGLGNDLFGFGASLLVAGVGAGSCLEMGVGCVLLIGGAAGVYKEARDIQFKLDAIVDANNTGEEKFYFISNSVSEMFP